MGNYIFGGSSIEDVAYQLRYSASKLRGQSNRCTVDSESEKRLAQWKGRRGDRISAQTHAENSVRLRKEGQQYLQLSSRMESLSHRLKSAGAMRDMSDQMKEVTRQLDKVVKTLDIKELDKALEDFSQNIFKVDDSSKQINERLDGAARIGASASENDQQEVAEILGFIEDVQAVDVMDQMSISVPTHKPGTVAERKIKGQAEDGDEKKDDEDYEKLKERMKDLNRKA
jgi:charged multivesicular body protein 1